MYLSGVFVFLIGAYLGLALKGVSLTVFWNPAAILMIAVVPLLSVPTGTGSWRTFWRGLKAAIIPYKAVADGDMSRAALLRRLLLPKQYVTEDEIGRAASLFRLLSKVTALCTGIFLLLSIIAMFARIGDIQVLGHSITGALVAMTLAPILIAGIYEPAVFVLKKRQAELRGQTSKE